MIAHILINMFFLACMRPKAKHVIAMLVHGLKCSIFIIKAVAGGIL